MADRPLTNPALFHGCLLRQIKIYSKMIAGLGVLSDQIVVYSNPLQMYKSRGSNI
jgi:hypothetical protein